MKIIIMAGGKGMRFWPKSVERKPKQFLSLVSRETMLQHTYHRFRNWLPSDRIYVVTPKIYQNLVKEQLPEMAEKQLIIEPHQRDTGPCIALTARHFLEEGDDDVLITVPSDHHISDWEALLRILTKAEQTVCRTGAAAVIGIVPTRPDSGFGYIRASNRTDDHEVLKVQEFIEKPPVERARELIRSEDVFWNSGIVVWKPSMIADYMKRHQAEMWSILNGHGDLSEIYAHLPKISVDYAILEKANDLFCIPATFAWDDVGTWKAIERLHSPDADGNTIMGETLLSMTRNSLIFTEHHKAVVIGVKDLIIVSTPDGLLVCHKSKEDQIKKVLENLRSESD